MQKKTTKTTKLGKQTSADKMLDFIQREGALLCCHHSGKWEIQTELVGVKGTSARDAIQKAMQEHIEYEKFYGKT